MEEDLKFLDAYDYIIDGPFMANPLTATGYWPVTVECWKSKYITTLPVVSDWCGRRAKFRRRLFGHGTAGGRDSSPEQVLWFQGHAPGVRFPGSGCPGT